MLPSYVFPISVSICTEQEENQDTPLHDAIHKFSNECVRILLNQRSINLRIPNNKGMMALHFAALRDNVE